MTYAKRTCHSCGIRKPQPEMVRETVYNEVARSRPGVSAATGIGLFLGDKKSASWVQRWLFNSGQRTYQRKREVWMCRSCGHRENPGFFGTIMNIFGLIIIFSGLFFGLTVLIAIIEAVNNAQ